MNPTYPVYVISKGRWQEKRRLTVEALERIGVPYRVVVESQEYDQYAAVIDPAKILKMPWGDIHLGPTPARNFVWEHAISTGAARHWILDDNIRGFYRLNHNLKLKVADGTVFWEAEKFVNGHDNVALAGFQYFGFAYAKKKLPPYYLNTRIYSCILVNNDLPYRWRGGYNEATDLSLRALKDGWSTVMFYAFLQDKATTMTIKGGNTDELYQDKERFHVAESLRLLHPDVVKIAWKWGRWQHQVNYRSFKNNRLDIRTNLEAEEIMSNKEIEALFEGSESWKESWKGRPDFFQHDIKPLKSLLVEFPDEDAFEMFKKNNPNLSMSRSPRA